MVALPVMLGRDVSERDLPLLHGVDGQTTFELREDEC